jgi:UV excision repair protein RAD23
VNLQAFQLNLEETDTVLALKNKIHSTKGDAFEAGLLKLIHTGKILKDEDTLASAGVKDNGFVVCMVSKPKVRLCCSLKKVFS